MKHQNYEEARQKAEELYAQWQAKHNEHKRLSDFRIYRNTHGGVYLREMTNKQPESVGTSEEIAVVALERDELYQEWKKADAFASELLRARRREARAAALVTAPDELAELVTGDEQLLAQVKAEAQALRRTLAQWNERAKRKAELRQLIREETGETHDAGLLGRVDAHWHAWLLANTEDDAEISRKVDMLAQGRWNGQMPGDAFVRTMQEARAQTT